VVLSEGIVGSISGTDSSPPREVVEWVRRWGARVFYLLKADGEKKNKKKRSRRRTRFQLTEARRESIVEEVRRLGVPGGSTIYLLGATHEESEARGEAAEWARWLARLLIHLLSEPALMGELREIEQGSPGAPTGYRFVAVGYDDVVVDEVWAVRRLRSILARRVLAGVFGGGGRREKDQQSAPSPWDLEKTTERLVAAALQVEAGGSDTGGSDTSSIVNALASQLRALSSRRPESVGVLARVALTSRAWREGCSTQRVELELEPSIRDAVCEELARRWCDCKVAPEQVLRLLTGVAERLAGTIGTLGRTQHERRIRIALNREVEVWRWTRRTLPAPPRIERNSKRLESLLIGGGLALGALLLLLVLPVGLPLAGPLVAALLIALGVTFLLLRPGQSKEPQPPRGPVGPSETQVVGALVEEIAGVRDTQRKIERMQVLLGVITNLVAAMSKVAALRESLRTSTGGQSRKRDRAGRHNRALLRVLSEHVSSRLGDGWEELILRADTVKTLLMALAREPDNMRPAYRCLATTLESAISSSLADCSAEKVISTTLYGKDRLTWPLVDRWAEAVGLSIPEDATPSGLEDVILGLARESPLAEAGREAAATGARVRVVPLRCRNVAVLLRLRRLDPWVGLQAGSDKRIPGTESMGSS
jgi:hypothetical protein